MLASDCNPRVVGLEIDEVAEQAEELHLWQVLCEHVHVAFKREANVDRCFVGEDLGQVLVKDRVVSQGDQVDEEGVSLVRDLEQGRPHRVKLSHRGSPLAINADEGLTH